MTGGPASRAQTQAALKAHAAGNRVEAQRLYRAALALDPDDAAALHGLGLLVFEGGEREQGLALLEKAVRNAPQSAEFRRHHAHCLALAGSLDPAIAAFGALLKLPDTEADDWTRLGILQAQRGLYGDAAASFEGALSRLAPSSPERIASLRRLGQAQRRAGLGSAAVRSWMTALTLDRGQTEIALHLGDLLLELGRPAEAETVYRQALAAKPDALDLQINLGVMLREAGRSEEAEAAFRAALGLDPASALARRNLALALHDRGRDEEALAEIQAVLKTAPQDPPALTVAASLLLALDRPAEALELADRVSRLEPGSTRVQAIRARSLLKLDRSEAALEAAHAVQRASRDADALHDAASVFRDLGLMEPAIGCYRQAIAARPGYVDAHVNLGGALLSCGQFAEGWQEYEWRWQRSPGRERRNRPLPQPFWDGARPLSGRLLVWNEQGIGDEILFSSLLPEIARDLGCILECDPRLVGLLGRSLPGVELVARRQPPQLDPRLLASDIVAQIPAGGLAALLRPTLESFAGKGDAYLRPDPERRQALRTRYDDGRLLVGIAWHTIADSAQGRSLTLERLEPVLRTPGVRFVSVQYGDHAEEIAALARRSGVELLQDASVDPMTDLDGFAAQLAAVDLVVTIDNSTAHFAGALGVPCWVLLPHWAEWRWQREGSASIWWRSLRLFRQTKRNDWRGPLADLAAALAQRLSGKDAATVGSPEPRFETALSLYQSKEFPAAAAMLERLVGREPRRGEAWHLLGVIRSQAGDAEGALAALERAVALNPRDAEALGNLARLQVARKRQDLAAPLLQQAVVSAPHDAGLWRDLARAKRSLGDTDGAIEALERVLALRPADAAAMIDLAGLFARRGDPRRAHELYAKAAALDPKDAPVQRQLAEGFRNLGLLAEARTAALRAVALDPGHAFGHALLGDILRMMEDFAGAEAALDRALALAPDLMLANFYKGLLENDLTRVDSAIAWLDKALALDPEHADLHWNRAVMNIRRGRWREGFAEYEWRFRSSLFVGGPHPPLPVRPKPEELAGRRVWLTAEQGIGDAIQFLRYAARVARAGATPILEAPAELLDLARSTAGVAEVIARGSTPPAHDIALPLMSLPHVFGTEIDTVPADVPYLHPDPAAAAAWAKRLEALPRPRIGLAWQGNPAHRNDRNRSIALARLKPLIEATPAGWVSLQKGTGSEQVAAADLSGRLYEAGPGLRDFADTAALVANLDLVVTIDSAVAHLCGALGRAVLLLLPWSPDFRWMLDRPDTPWYPTMRLLRQAQRRDWSVPLAELRSILAGAGPGGFQLFPERARQTARQKLEAQVAELSARLARAPQDVALLTRLSSLERALGRSGAAVALARRALLQEADSPPALAALGHALSDQGDVEGAIAAYEALLRRQPENVSALANLSTLRLRRIGGVAGTIGPIATDRPLAEAIGDALSLARRALAIDPGSAPAILAVGAALMRAGDVDGAADAYERALAIEPAHAIALVNLTLLCLRQGRAAEAEALGRRAVAVAPDHPQAHWHLALALLTNSKLREGWEEFAWRWLTPFEQAQRRRWPWPQWRGERLDGKLLVWNEQGIGDELMFSSLLPELARRADLTVECDPRLMTLLGRSLPDVALRARPPSPVDGGPQPQGIVAQVSAADLPRLLRPDLGSFAGHGGAYLEADPARRDSLRRRYGLERSRLGLAWHTASRTDAEARRVPLAMFLPLLRDRRLHVISLQYGDHQAEIRALAAQGGAITLDPAIDPLTDLDGFAAQIAALDLVITIDNSTAHMAGALGVPCWVLLPYAAEWRWLRDREDCVWWPSLRLFRQERRGDWSAPLARLQAELAGWLETRGAPVPGVPSTSEIEAAHRRFQQLRDAGKLDEAAALLEDWLRRHPDNAGLLAELSVIERKRRHVEASLAHARHAAAIAPDFAPAQLALGAALSDIDEVDAAADAYEKVLVKAPDNNVALTNLSALRLRQGRAAEAEALGRRAVAVAPEHGSAHWNLSHALLSNGNFREGWAAYEWRWKAGTLDAEKRDWPWPPWQGEPLQGRRILVFAEQGFGDTLQFVRLLPALKALGATVLLEVQPALKRLLANAPGVDRIFARGDRLPPVDFQVPLMSLPHRLGLTLETIPAPVPYLAAEPEARAAWRQRLSNLKRPHVGLCWQGGREHKVDRWRSLPLARLTPLIAASDASFISLQKEDDRAEIAAAGLEGRLRSVAAELGDFADTAALIEDLDLVICVDTAVGHLAGALGKPVWLLLGFAPDFRWMRDRADNPWYPFHRLYRQERWGDWSVPLAGIGRALPGILAEFPGPTVPPAASTNLKK
ncbi:hypothetical protein FRZ61_11630 [Hypericibacter adhaerens]|uniref:Tetratricopeptide repeat protein n=1 Tax=Hypericibacter adhaerens TaxID=2602016 RepID=A0A5J6MY93_9PROT|nr:tetratricopeptide repeat protein [Hypericibacter adhaerens]QEX21240.1 hypothetical protein FRZ61_11630 [Hypericibacter adhaerens]